MALTVGVWLFGCGMPARSPDAASTKGNEPRIMLDGDVGEWPLADAAMADPHHLYLRFTVADESFTLQAAPKSVVIYLDADADIRTGRRSDDEALAGLGVDLELVFSPGERAGGKRQGAKLFAIDQAGGATELSTRAFDVIAAPTVAATWYEARISRTPAATSPLPRAGLLSSGKVRGVMAALDARGAIEAWADPFEVDCPSVSRGGARLADMALPARPAGSVRVVSYNVRHSSPLKDAPRFRRILEVLAPDVVLLQEWEEGSGDQVAGWFTAMLPDERPWNVVKAPGTMGEGGGVAIATRLPMVDVTTPLVVRNVDKDHRVRVVMARITTSIGDIAAASVHLKCCGSAGSPEDRLRASETTAINRELARLAGGHGGGPGGGFGGGIVIGGDMNLVGSWGPIASLGAGLDADQSDLEIARARVHGDGTLVTWRDASTPFTPGRLDYVLYSDARWVVRNAFVLDTTRMSDELLARLGLDGDDTQRASDHMPVVIDLGRRAMR